MSKAEIMAELEKLSPEDRQDVRLKLAELDNDQWLDDGVLTEEEKGLIESRLEQCERNPEVFVPWQQAKEQLKARFKK